LSWSPDGKVLAILDKESHEDPDAIYLLSIDTGEKRRLTDPPRSCTFDSRFCGEWTPAFSPDGRWIAFFRTNDRQILRVPVQGGEPSPITRPAGWAFTLAWTRDGTGLIFSGSSEYGPFKLWRVSSSGGDAEPLPITDDALRPTLSRVGSRMVYVKDLSDTNLWAIDGPKAKQKKGPRKLIASTQDEYGFDVSPDGKRIAFSSARTGAADIWVADSEGRDPVQLTFLGEAVGADYPQWSPDGRWIAFSVWSPDSELDVYLVPTEGGAPRRLTEWPSRDMVASWSRDGKWIYFTSARSGPYETWKVRIDGGDPIQVTHTGGVGARESPDGRFLFVMKVGSPAILRLSMENGEEEKLIDRNGWPFDVSDEGIVFVDSPGGEKPAIRYYEFSTGKVSTVAVLENAPQISVSPDGEWIVYDQQDVTGSDLVLVENFR
jgi:Tol biopolymer transport system component